MENDYGILHIVLPKLKDLPELRSEATISAAECVGRSFSTLTKN